MSTSNICRKCNTEFIGKFCSNCGQTAKLKRIDAYYIKHELEHILHFDKGIFFTIKELLINPGNSVKEFITVDRNRLVKPIVFIIVSSLIYSLSTHFFHIEEGYISFDFGESTKPASAGILNWVKEHYGYVNLIIGVFITFWLELFFRKYKYNFFEILILLCFVIGITMLIHSVFAGIQTFFNFNVMQIGGYVATVYTIWAIGQFFNRKKMSSYLLAFASYILGLASFGLATFLIVIISDFFLK